MQEVAPSPSSPPERTRPRPWVAQGFSLSAAGGRACSVGLDLRRRVSAPPPPRTLPLVHTHSPPPARRAPPRAARHAGRGRSRSRGRANTSSCRAPWAGQPAGGPPASLSRLQRGLELPSASCHQAHPAGGPTGAPALTCLCWSPGRGGPRLLEAVMSSAMYPRHGSRRHSPEPVSSSFPL